MEYWCRIGVDRHVQAHALAEGSGPGACRIDHDRGADVPGGGVYQVLAMAAEGEAGDARVWVRNVTPRRCAAVANPTAVRCGLTKPSRGGHLVF